MKKKKKKNNMNCNQHENQNLQQINENEEEKQNLIQCKNQFSKTHEQIFDQETINCEKNCKLESKQPILFAFNQGNRRRKSNIRRHLLSFPNLNSLHRLSHSPLCFDRYSKMSKTQNSFHTSNPKTTRTRKNRNLKIYRQNFIVVFWMQV